MFNFFLNLIGLYYSSRCRSGYVDCSMNIYNSVDQTVDLTYSVATPAGVNLI